MRAIRSLPPFLPSSLFPRLTKLTDQLPLTRQHPLTASRSDSTRSEEVDALRRKLDRSEARVTQLEGSLQQAESKVRPIIPLFPFPSPACPYRS